MMEMLRNTGKHIWAFNNICVHANDHKGKMGLPEK